MMIKTAAPILFLSIAAVAPAHAGDFRFHYARSELETPAGVETLYSRIEHIADRLCVDRNRAVNWPVAQQEECAAEVVAELVEGVDDTRLFAVYEKAQGEKQYARRD